MRCCVKIIVNKAQYMVMKTNTFLSSMGFFNSVFFFKNSLDRAQHGQTLESVSDHPNQSY